MKVIFLDIDGVLVSEDYKKYLYQRDKNSNGELKPRDQFGLLFDPTCVWNLEYLLSQTNAKVVISSHWRKSGLAVIEKMFFERDIRVEVIDITPTLNVIRGKEIEQWLERHPEVTNYVILDDNNDMTTNQSLCHLVWINPKVGLNAFYRNLAVGILNR